MIKVLYIPGGLRCSLKVVDKNKWICASLEASKISTIMEFSLNFSTTLHEMNSYRVIIYTTQIRILNGCCKVGKNVDRILRMVAAFWDLEI